MQCLSYELAFNALKYQDLLEDIMTGSCFYFIRHIPDGQKCLVAVMLYDFQDRNFLPRKWFGEDFIQEVRDVENYLIRFKTKLAASLARCRVKHNLSSIECFLPESVKVKQERSRCLPLYGWVNTLRSSLDEVQMVLKRVGFSQVESIGQLEGQTFCQDPHCGDLLVFPARQKAELYSSTLLSEYKLIIQDKSCSSLAPNVLRQLLTDKGDVSYDVKQIPEDFQSLSSLDKRLEKVRAIMLTPRCSVSAVSNPVELILQENGDMNLLQDLSQGSVAQGKLEALVEQQKKDINHALTFPKVSVVVYSTRSSHLEENEEVVSSALKQAEAELELSHCPFKPDDTKEPGSFFNLKPSEQSNGCFVAALTRQ
ncbi:LOW QUALITY PROTEIN: putative methyltransferase NSUN7, partial [Lampetra planeri]